MYATCRLSDVFVTCSDHIAAFMLNMNAAPNSIIAANAWSRSMPSLEEPSGRLMLSAKPSLGEKTLRRLVLTKAKSAKSTAGRWEKRGRTSGAGSRFVYLVEKKPVVARRRLLERIGLGEGATHGTRASP